MVKFMTKILLQVYKIIKTGAMVRSVLASLVEWVVLRKDSTVWMDGARPPNTLFPGESTCTTMQQTHPQKYVCRYRKLNLKQTVKKR